MADLILSGRIAELIASVMLIEAIVLIVYHRRTGRGITPGHIFSNLIPGLCLLAALRCALTGAGWEWVALSLAASGVAHVADLKSRWRA